MAPWGQERSALGIEAASFFREGGDEAEKDRAESPTRSGTPKRKRLRTNDKGLRAKESLRICRIENLIMN